MPIIWVYTEIKEIDMFIYKGRIYRKRNWIKYGFCEGCDFYDGDGSCGQMEDANAKDCSGYSFHELFISRLFHAIIEVFYGAAK